MNELTQAPQVEAVDTTEPSRVDRRTPVQSIDQSTQRNGLQAKAVQRTGNAVGRRIADLLADVDGIHVLVGRDTVFSDVDCVVVGPSGVFVVDAPQLSGRVEFALVRRRLRRELHLVVNGYDRTALADGLRRREATVRQAMSGCYSDVHLRGALCLIGCDIERAQQPRWVQDVLVTWPGRLPATVARSGPVSESRRRNVAAHLRAQLPDLD